MGSKGSNTTTQNTTQTYTPNPVTNQAATTAIGAAEQAAATPFSQPVAPVAGLNQTQQNAFGQYANLAGPNNPYINNASQLYGQSGAQITPQDINAFYNPMASNVTSQLQNIYGEQNAQNQGSLTAQAGGVGADRIAVGMGDLANQQTLAAGQVYSGLYQNALTAAQQQKQNEAGAAAGFLNTGSQALNNTNAYLGTGNQQQAQTQQELNAPYQQQLAQIAYPFQTAQYLAGITGGLSGALGGTTSGQSVTQAPTPSLLSQLLGIGTAGAGIYGALGSPGSPSYGNGNGVYGGSSTNPLPGLTAADYGPGYASGGAADETGGGDPFPGITPADAAFLSPVPSGKGITSQANSGPQLHYAAPAGNSSNGANLASDAASIGKLAMMFANRGGVAGFDDGGDTTDSPNPWNPMNWFSSPAAAQPVVPSPTAPELSAAKSGLADRMRQAFPQPAAASDPIRIDQDAGDAWRKNTPKPEADDVGPQSIPGIVKAAQSANAYPDASSAITQSMMPQSQQPYPDALSRDWGQEAARSPWLALVSAGAKMASTPGPLGQSIGAGLQAGVNQLDTSRKELRSEQELNDKAQTLYQQAKTELDKYNKMTPYEQASITARNKEIDQTDAASGTTKTYLAARKQAASEVKQLLASDPTAALKYTPEQIDSLTERRAQQIVQQATGKAPAGAGAVAPPGSSKDTAQPDPGPAGRIKGMWYIGPSGSPQQWLG